MMEDCQIPDDFKDVTISSSSFYMLPNVLDQVQSPDQIIPCHILLTESNSLVEIHFGQVKRTHLLPLKNPKKVVVHHEFDPFLLYVFILDEERTMHLFTYDSLQELNTWNEVDDMFSDDTTTEGRPSLHMVTSSGIITLSSKDFVKSNVDSFSEGQNNAIKYISKKINDAKIMADYAKSERRSKEMFIQRKTLLLKEQLSRESPSRESLNRELFDSSKNFPSNSLYHPFAAYPPLLRVLSTRQRVINRKWVLCITILNESDKFLIENPNIVLQLDPSIDELQFKVSALKIFRKFSHGSKHRAETGNETVVEKLSRPILKPQKRIFLMAVCDLPSFCRSDSVSLNGVIKYGIRPINSNGVSTQMPAELSRDAEVGGSIVKQVSFGPVRLDASDIHSVSIESVPETKTSGIPLDVVSLIAASSKRQLRLQSSIFTISEITKRIIEDQRIYKVPDLTNFFCFNSKSSVLEHAAFSWKIISEYEMELDIYTMDESQAMLLLHNLKKIFVGGVRLSEISAHKTEALKDSESELTSKMYEIIDKVLAVFKGSDSKSSRIRQKMQNIGVDTSANRKKFIDLKSELISMCYDMDVLYNESVKKHV